MEDAVRDEEAPASRALPPAPGRRTAPRRGWARALLGFAAALALVLLSGGPAASGAGSPFGGGGIGLNPGSTTTVPGGAPVTTAPPATTTTIPAGPGAPAPGSHAVGITASWLPTTQPVIATPGQTSTGYFWVTNNEQSAVGIHILPGTAIPGNNGQLSVQPGADPRFPGDIAYAPEAFTAPPRSTTRINVTVHMPDLGSGVYILVFVVRPDVTSPGIAVVNEINALVTFQVPGPQVTGMSANFIDSGYHVPGFPPIQVGPQGSTTLHVVDTGRSTVFSYNEITLTQSPFGTASAAGHTPGLPGDVRNDVALFFPGRYRNFLVTWNSTPLGLGHVHLSAAVSYHGNNNGLQALIVTTNVLVIAPLWFLALAVWEALLLLLALRGSWTLARPRGQPPAVPTRKKGAALGHLLGAVVLVLLTVVTGALSDKPALWVSLGVAAALAVGLLVAHLRASPSTVARILAYGLFPLAGLGLLAGAAGIIALAAGWGGLAGAGPGTARALLCGVALLLLAGQWALWHLQKEAAASGAPPRGPVRPTPAEPPAAPVPA